MQSALRSIKATRICSAAQARLSEFPRPGKTGQSTAFRGDSDVSEVRARLVLSPGWPFNSPSAGPTPSWFNKELKANEAATASRAKHRLSRRNFMSRKLFGQARNM